MKYENNDRLREYLDRGAAGAYREHLRHERFEFNAEAFAAALDQVCAQFPGLTLEEAEARAAFRLLTSGVAPEVAVPLPSRWFRVTRSVREKSIRSWPWLKVGWAIAVLLLCVAAVVLLSAMAARAEPTPQNLLAYRNALRGMSLLAASPAGLAAQQPNGIILQFQQGGSALATRPAGLVAFNCSTGLSCSFSGTTFTLTSMGAGGTGCLPPGTSSRLLYDDGAGGCLDSGLTWSGSTATAPSGITLTYSGSGVINARQWASTAITNTESFGKIPIGNGDGTASWSDPFVSGITPHDAVATSTNPVLMGGHASATAPPDVSGDGDAVRAWHLRNGSQVFNLASGGTLVTLGQKTMSGSLPVTIASDQGAVPVSGSGNFTVTQGTGTNLHAVIDSGSTAAVTQTTASNLNAQIVGNAGSGASDAGNPVKVGGVFNTTLPTLTNGQRGDFQVNAKGEQLGVVCDAAGNLRCANVTAGNAVSVDGSAVTQPVSIAATVSSNIAQVAGNTALTGNGATGNGSPRVTIASDNTALPQIGGSATGSAVPAQARYVGGNGTGNLVGYLNCDSTAIYDASTSGSTQLVALTASQSVYVCGFQISQSSTTAVSVNLRYGTGTNCATGATNITPSYPLQAPTATGPIGMVVMTAGFTGLKTAASNALCINTSAAVSVQALVWYTKF